MRCINCKNCLAVDSWGHIFCYIVEEWGDENPDAPCENYDPKGSEVEE